MWHFGISVVGHLHAWELCALFPARFCKVLNFGLVGFARMPGCREDCILTPIFCILTARMQSQDALGCKKNKKSAIRRPFPATTIKCQDAPGCNIFVKIAASWIHPGSLCDATVCVVASTLHPRCILCLALLGTSCCRAMKYKQKKAQVNRTNERTNGLIPSELYRTRYV